MKQIIENIAAMVKVKTVVTLVVIAVFAVLALRKDIQPDSAMTVITMSVAFYFGTQSEKRNEGK